MDGALTRTGVFSYVLGDGTTRREYRPPEEVFAPASLASYAGATVTDGHPAEFVDATNWRTVAVGHVPAPGIQDGIHVVAPIVIQDAAMLAMVDSGDRTEISNGYLADLDPTPGVSPEGEPYDAIQRGIVINHVALLPPGTARAGSTARLRLDAGACISHDMAQPDAKRHTDDAAPCTQCAALKAAVQDAESRADKAEAQAKAGPSPEAIRKAAKDLALVQVQAARFKVDADGAGMSPEGDDAIIMGILKKAGLDLSKIPNVTHEQLMAFLQSVAGAPAPADAPKDTPPADAPPAPPGTTDAVSAARGDVPPRQDATPSTYTDRAAAARKRRENAWRRDPSH